MEGNILEWRTMRYAMLVMVHFRHKQDEHSLFDTAQERRGDELIIRTEKAHCQRTLA